MKRSFKLIIIFAVILMPLSAMSATIEVPDSIRVVVADDMPTLELSVRGRFRVVTVETRELLQEVKKSVFPIKVSSDAYGINLGKDYFKIHAIEIMPEREPAISIGKRLYRGSLLIMRTKEGSLRAINIVGLDDYLKGVLYHEISHRWPMESIKAQAIASRTFALYQAQQNRTKDYYLKADISSQVYGGVYGERYRTNKAVDQPRGEVLTYRGKLLPAFFHATCGGKTENAARLWNVNLRPLKGTKCPFCKHSPHFYWSRSISVSDIIERLKKNGYEVSDIISIDTGRRDPSGRLIDLTLVGKKDSVEISAKHFRHFVGSDAIRSADFVVSVKGGIANFSGKGWGHGVGLCQWGAFTMGREGEAAEEILRHYYPGSKLVKLRQAETP